MEKIEETLEQKFKPYEENIKSYLAANNKQQWSTKWLVRRAIWQSKEFCKSPVHLIRAPSLKFFCQMNKFRN